MNRNPNDPHKFETYISNVLYREKVMWPNCWAWHFKNILHLVSDWPLIQSNDLTFLNVWVYFKELREILGGTFRAFINSRFLSFGMVVTACAVQAGPDFLLGFYT